MTRTPATPQTSPLHSLAALRQAGLLPSGPEDNALEAVAARYAVAVTPAMAALIARDGPGSAMARQFIPSTAEARLAPGESDDPIGDEAHSPVEGVVHRYADRALLKIVHACPVYCRFCFRREMVGPARPALAGAKLDAALAYLAATPALWEVVMTGGDPFILSARRVRDVTGRIAAIPHIKVLRWHTRVPMVAPERITPEFARALRARGLSSWVAIHANHPSEFTPAAQAALARLAEAGVQLVSQSVLLRGVNDDAATLERLMRLFVENGVKPYYLHHPDMAPGTGHFRLPVATGQALMRELRQTLSGLAMPHYVLDLPGGHGKAALAEAQPTPGHSPATYQISDRHGHLHSYTESVPAPLVHPAPGGQ
jgi:lysine 2,3-aminomutase